MEICIEIRIFGLLTLISVFKKLFINHPISKFNVQKIYVDPDISPSGLFYRYKNSDLEKIKKLHLDLLIRGGSGILKGKILNICRLGIISFHHGDNNLNRGGPPGFWEVFNQEPSTGFIIQRLTEEIDGGEVVVVSEQAVEDSPLKINSIDGMFNVCTALSLISWLYFFRNSDIILETVLNYDGTFKNDRENNIPIYC